MSSSKSVSTSKKVPYRKKVVETSISVDSSISSLSDNDVRKGFFTCCAIICAFLSVAVISSVLTFAMTTAFHTYHNNASSTVTAARTAEQSAELSKIYGFLVSIQNWFVSHNSYTIQIYPGNDTGNVDYGMNLPCKKNPKKLPEGIPDTEIARMNFQPYPTPINFVPCSSAPCPSVPDVTVDEA